jgi:hypothetical protein
MSSWNKNKVVNKGEKKMQIRIWGTPQENEVMLQILRKGLNDKIKVVSSHYLSKNNNTQRIYVEIDLENRDYRKYNKQVTDSKTEISHFDEHNFFNEITKKNKIK